MPQRSEGSAGIGEERDIVALGGGCPDDVGRYGGKAVGLARLLAAGFHVPPGLCVSGEVFRRHAARALGSERASLRDALDRAGVPDPAKIDRAAARVRGTPLEPDVVEAIRRGLSALGLADRPVAVRSSGSFEDRADWSSAGLQETVLGCTGVAEVCAAVVRCYASAWRASTLSYLVRAGAALDEMSLALVIQALVRAEASGVLFMINPVSGNAGEIVVNARLGSGEALVSGRCTPESLILDRATLRVLRRDISPDAACRVLDDARARDLGRLALRAEATLGGPLDIEWAFDAEDPDRIALLQARPITAAAPGTPTLARQLPDGRGASSRGPWA